MTEPTLRPLQRSHWPSAPRITRPTGLPNALDLCLLNLEDRIEHYRLSGLNSGEDIICHRSGGCSAQLMVTRTNRESSVETEFSVAMLFIFNEPLAGSPDTQCTLFRFYEENGQLICEFEGRNGRDATKQISTATTIAGALKPLSKECAMQAVDQLLDRLAHRPVLAL